MHKIASAFFIFLFACKPEPQPAKDITHSPAAEPSITIMTQADRRNFYRWLVSEMYEQILILPAQSGPKVDQWVNVFIQGASIEGVYHGIVLSNDYAAREQGKANVQALRWFAEEMAYFDNPLKSVGDLETKKGVELYIKDHLNSSLFTLKRLLGERVLKEVNSRKDDRERLSDWYSSLVVHWGRTDISFGMLSRNKLDLGFHKNWAKENSLGLIQWELLNRVHRILNYKGGVALLSPRDK